MFEVKADGLSHTNSGMVQASRLNGAEFEALACQILSVFSESCANVEPRACGFGYQGLRVAPLVCQGAKWLRLESSACVVTS